MESQPIKRNSRTSESGSLDLTEERGRLSVKVHPPLRKSFFSRTVVLIACALTVALPLLAYIRPSALTLSSGVPHSHYAAWGAQAGLLDEDPPESDLPVQGHTWIETPYDLPLSQAEVEAMSPPATIGSLAAQLEGLQSSYNCSVAEPGFMDTYITCVYEYLVLWEGQLYFMHPNRSVEPPAVNVDWMLGAVLGIERNASLQEVPLEGNTSSTGVPADVEVLVYDRAVLTFFTFSHNFYHVFAEYMPSTHMQICDAWGMCDYDPHGNVQLIMVNPFSIHDAKLADPVTRDFSRCVTTAPVRHTQSPQWAGKLVLLKQVLAGWGPYARADHSHVHHWNHRRPPPRPVMRRWRDRVASCLQFDPRRYASRDPVHVIIVDRGYGVGRTFLNVDQMAELVERKWPLANVTVAYLEGKELHTSAALFNEATVVIWQHGAAMANLLFLPKGASGIQIVMKDRPKELYDWPDELVRDYPNPLRLVHMINTDPDKIIMRPGYTRWNDEYGHKLTLEQKLRIWERKECPTEDELVNHFCEEFWFKIGSSLEVDLVKLEEALDLVMPEYYYLQRRQ